MVINVKWFPTQYSWGQPITFLLAVTVLSINWIWGLKSMCLWRSVTSCMSHFMCELFTHLLRLHVWLFHTPSASSSANESSSIPPGIVKSMNFPFSGSSLVESSQEKGWLWIVVVLVWGSGKINSNRFSQWFLVCYEPARSSFCTHIVRSLLFSSYFGSNCSLAWKWWVKIINLYWTIHGFHSFQSNRPSCILTLTHNNRIFRQNSYR